MEGLQVWIRFVNDRGGVGGHPVRLTVVDDGEDPARHRTIIQQQVEQKNVLAFVNNTAGQTGRASFDYLTAKRVPVIGSETGSQWYYESPVYFPQTTSGQALLYAAIASTAEQVLPQGKAKFGMLSCVEAQFCDDAVRAGPTIAKERGLQPVYNGRTSLAQPDFTAECLAAKSAGVEVLQINLDPNSVQRVAASCARQGFRPIMSLLSALVFDRMRNDPNLDGMVANSGTFPYFQSSTPETAEFHQAMARYGPGITPGIGQASGWVSGKLFERGAAKLASVTDREGVLRALWSIHGDTLGGLTIPLRFSPEKPAEVVICWHSFSLHNGAWVSPDHFALHCR